MAAIWGDGLSVPQKPPLKILLSHERFIFYFLFIFFIGEYLIYNVVSVSGVQQSDLVTHINISILFQFLFPYSLLESIELSSLYYTVGLC